MRIIIPRYKSWLATAALLAVLTAFFANVAPAAPTTSDFDCVYGINRVEHGVIELINHVTTKGTKK